MKQFFTVAGFSFWCFLVLSLLAGPAARAQAPTWQAAVAVGPASGGFSSVAATAADGSGNLFVVGTYTGAITLGNNSLTSAGPVNTFVAKWNPDTNTYLWAQRVGWGASMQPKAIAANGASIYIAGQFQGTATVGPATLSSAGNQDVFVAKLTDVGTSGSVVWAQRAGSNNDDTVTALAVSGSNVYVAGYFLGAIADFGPIAISNTITYLADGFVAKLIDGGSTGAFAWVQRLGSNLDDTIDALAVNGTSIYVAGYLQNTATFAGQTITKLFPATLLLAKLADVGNSSSLVWTQQAGGAAPIGSASGATATALAVSGTTIYLTGILRASASFGSTLLASAGSNDVFVAKLTDVGSSGAFAWAQRAGGIDNEQPTALAVDGASVYVSGIFVGTITIGGTALISASYTDIFVAKMLDAGSTGAFVWATQAGSSGADFAPALTVLGGRTVCLGGGVAATATFGSRIVSVPPGAYVGFLATLQQNTGPATTAADLAFAITLYPNPAHTRATVQLPLIPGAATATLSVLDALGRTLRTKTAVPNSKAEVDLTGLAPGLYALRVAAGANTVTQRLVVE